jgi:DNA-binding GntR family transcriptional regulator/imidazolonepropionase-like amidohydrolase
MKPLVRTRLRDDIVQQLGELIASGELPVVERLKEVELARRLGVSRTPLREALLILERKGLVMSEAHKGFRITVLSEARVRELYPILGSLEALAVADGGNALRERAGELRALNDRITHVKTRRARWGADRAFHEALWSGTRNATLVEMLRTLWLQAQRYDGATERGLAAPESSHADHAQIVAAIDDGKLGRAAQYVEAHWRHGIDIVVRWLRQRTTTPGLALLVVAALAGANAACGGTQSQPAPPQPELDDEPFGYFIDEAAIDTYVERISRAHQPSVVAFRDITIVNADASTPGQTIVVANGVVRALGTHVDIPAGATIVDGRGRFAIPGLVDMHVHTNLSDAQYLLDLANGVTSVREMNGTPSLLRQREAARTNRLLAPNLYVVGPILASRPLGSYAEVVTTPDEARRAVRAHRAAGYEAIKVHNIVAREVYDAICDEARAVGLDVVGHIPHDTTVARAVACGQRTFEHFKGYIDDRNLTLTGEDYVAATDGAEVWNTPTFYNYRTHLRDDAAKRLVREAPEMRYVPARDRAAWLALADEPVKPIQHEVLRLSKKIFADLRPIGARFLAGTDSGGGYPYHVRGFSLHEELRMMASLGMTGRELLAAATSEPARAMRKEHELGTIAVGRRADIVLLRADPIVDPAAFSAIDGVMVRGIWLSRSTIDSILAQLADFAEPPRRTQRDLDLALDTLAALQARGYILRERMLRMLRHALDVARLAHPLTRDVEPLSPD